MNWGVMEVRYFRRGAESSSETVLASARVDAAALYAWLENQLGAAPWLEGAAFGWADAAMVPYVAMSGLLELPAPQSSNVEAWLARSMARPAVSATVEELRVALPQMANVGRLLEAGGFRRQYRDHRLEWMIRAGGMDVVVDGLARDNIRFTELGPFASSGKKVGSA